MGVGSQAANASSIALVMEVSERLQEDMGSIEFVWGLGYMLGPPLGGVAYRYAGFSLAHLPAAFLSLLVAAFCLVLICCGPSTNEQRRHDHANASRERRADDGLEDDAVESQLRAAAGINHAALEVAGASAPSGSTRMSDATAERNERGWKRLCTMSVFAVCLGIVGHAAAQGFKVCPHVPYPALAQNSCCAGDVAIPPISHHAHHRVILSLLHEEPTKSPAHSPPHAAALDSAASLPPGNLPRPPPPPCPRRRLCSLRVGLHAGAAHLQCGMHAHRAPAGRARAASAHIVVGNVPLWRGLVWARCAVVHLSS